MRRRDFLAALAAGTGAIFVPQYGRWHRQGSGVLVREQSATEQLVRANGLRLSDLTGSTYPRWQATERLMTHGDFEAIIRKARMSYLTEWDRVVRP